MIVLSNMARVLKFLESTLYSYGHLYTSSTKTSHAHLLNPPCLLLLCRVVKSRVCCICVLHPVMTAISVVIGSIYTFSHLL